MSEWLVGNHCLLKLEKGNFMLEASTTEPFVFHNDGHIHHQAIVVFGGLPCKLQFLFSYSRSRVHCYDFARKGSSGILSSQCMHIDVVKMV